MPFEQLGIVTEKAFAENSLGIENPNNSRATPKKIVKDPRGIPPSLQGNGKLIAQQISFVAEQ
jgi:hypothetical protein